MPDADIIRRPYENMGYNTATISYHMVISIYGNTYCHIANTIGHTAPDCCQVQKDLLVYAEYIEHVEAGD